MDVQRLIGEVAKRHNVLITENDPILVTLTLNELLLAEYLERVHARVQAAEDEISAGVAQSLAASKDIAAQLVTGAAGYVAEQVKAAGASVQAELLEALRREVNAAREAAEQAARAKRYALSAAGVTLAAVALLAGIAWGMA